MKNFKQLALTVATSLLFAVATQAQVKIGDNPTAINANSMLEVESTNKGLLPPRVALTSTTAAAPLAANVAGMVVYNTATAGTAPNKVTPGLYVNDGVKWSKMVDSESLNTLGVASVESVASTVKGNLLIPTTTDFWTPTLTKFSDTDILADGTFTAPKAGYYLISLYADFLSSNGQSITMSLGTFFDTAGNTNSVYNTSTTRGPITGTMYWNSLNATGTVYLNANETIGPLILIKGVGVPFTTSQRFKNISATVVNLGNL